MSLLFSCCLGGAGPGTAGSGYGAGRGPDREHVFGDEPLEDTSIIPHDLVRVRVPLSVDARPGERCSLSIDEEYISWFDAATGERIQRAHIVA